MLGVVLAFALGACASGPVGEFEDGSAQFTVTYRPSPEAEPVSVDVSVDGTDCFVGGDTISFGEDVDPAARARHMEARVEDPWAVAGRHPGVVSASWSTGHSSRPELWIILPDGLLYYSTASFDVVDGAFEVTDHVGRVGTGAAALIVDDVDRLAQATGTFTCGSTDYPAGHGPVSLGAPEARPLAWSPSRDQLHPVERRLDVWTVGDGDVEDR